MHQTSTYRKVFWRMITDCFHSLLICSWSYSVRMFILFSVKQFLSMLTMVFPAACFTGWVSQFWVIWCCGSIWYSGSHSSWGETLAHHLRCIFFMLSHCFLFVSCIEFSPASRCSRFPGQLWNFSLCTVTHILVFTRLIAEISCKIIATKFF